MGIQRWRYIEKEVATLLSIMALLLFEKSDASSLFATMVRCSDNSTVLHFKQGESIDLCCYATKPRPERGQEIMTISRSRPASTNLDLPDAGRHHDLDMEEIYLDLPLEEYSTNEPIKNSDLVTTTDGKIPDRDQQFTGAGKRDREVLDGDRKSTQSPKGDWGSLDSDYTEIEEGSGKAGGDRYFSSSDGPASSVRLTLSNANADDSGLYTCSGNQTALYKNEVYVIEAPVRPEVTSVQCCANGQFIVVFDRGPPSQEYRDKYEVVLVINRFSNDKEMVLCNNMPDAMCQGSLCRCVYVFGEDDAIRVGPSYQEVTVSISALRSVQNVTGSKQLNLIEAYQPGNLQAIQIDAIETDTANLSLSLSEEMMDMYQYEIESGQMLWFSVVLDKLQGYPEQVSFNLSSVKEGDSSYTHTLEKISVTLTHLVPYTTYRVQVTGHGPGGAGQTELRDFTTPATAPLTPREIFFTIFPTSSHDESDLLDPILLQWKPLTHEEERGTNLVYHLTILDKKMNNIVYKTNTTGTRTLLHKLPKTSHLTAKLWTSNDFGDSSAVLEKDFPFVPRSEWLYAKQTTGPMLPFIVELFDKGTQALILMDLTMVESVEQVAIYWCWKWRASDGITECIDVPSSTLFSVRLNKDGIFNETVYLSSTMESDTKTHIETSNTKIKLDCFYTIMITDSLTTTSVHTLQASLTHDAKQYSNSPPLVISDNLADKSTSAQASETSVIHSKRHLKRFLSRLSVEQPDDNLNDEEQGPSDDQSSRQSFPFVTVSVKIDGKWSFSVPIDCYFNRDADTSLLSISESQSSPGSLEIQQKCSPGNDFNFLPNVVHVWTSPNDDCTDGKEDTQLFQNPVFEPITVAKTQSNAFFCVNGQSFLREDNTSAVSVPQSRLLELEKDGFSWYWFTIITAAIVSVSLIIIVICLCRRCHARGKTLREEAKHLGLQLSLHQKEDLLSKKSEAITVHSHEPEVSFVMLTEKDSSVKTQVCETSSDKDSGRASASFCNESSQETDHSASSKEMDHSASIKETDHSASSKETGFSSLSEETGLSASSGEQFSTDLDEKDCRAEPSIKPFAHNEIESVCCLVKHHEQRNLLEGLGIEFSMVLDGETDDEEDNHV